MVDPIDLIKKGNLTFPAKFIWLLVCRLSPTDADNQLTLNRAVLLEAMVARFDINFAIC